VEEMSDTPDAVALVEQLKSVPFDGTHLYQVCDIRHKNIPYGALCHSAASEIERLQRERKRINQFEVELKELINKHSIENTADMPEFLLADMICRFIEAVGPSIKDTLDWHGCDSVCRRSGRNERAPDTL
jgi:hypothetical protein